MRRVISTAVLGVMLSGCSVMMAANHKGTSLKDISGCRVEGCFDGLPDTSVVNRQPENGGSAVTYRSLMAKGSTGRAVVYGLFDVATLGISEAVTTPVEGGAQKSKYIVYTVHFDERGNVLKIDLNS